MVKFFQSASIEAITKDTPTEDVAVSASHVMLVKEKEVNKKKITVVVLSTGLVLFSPEAAENVKEGFYNFKF